MISDLLLPEVHASLARAIERDRANIGGDRRRRRGGHRLHFAVSRRAAVAATVGVLAGGTAVAATAPWSPIVGSADHGHPTTTGGPLPADELAALGVLRRPQVDADRNREVESVLTVLSPNVDSGVQIDGIRALDTGSQGMAVLVPIARDVTNAPGYRGPAEVTYNVLCLFYGASPTVAGAADTHSTAYGQKCGTVADLRAGRILMGGQGAGRLILTGLVPDGVASVQVALRTGSAITAPVTNNSFHIDTPAPDGSYEDAPIRWYAGDGSRAR